MKKLNLYLVMALCLFFTINTQAQLKPDKKHKFWAWARPSEKDTDDELRSRYKKYHDAGIRGLFFEHESERHFRIAKSQGLEAHRWMWIMNRGDKFIRENHPDWYAINRKGESCYDKPQYVNYYRWLCPSRPEVVEYLKNEVKNELKKDYVDGIHYDYIRYCDVVLPVNLWDKYKIVQTEELPEYDYCYCDICKEKFKKEYGQDIDKIEYPQESLSWRKFRQDAVANVVAELSKVTKENKKPATAAVFPYDFAARNVRQDWTNWDLDAAFPMIYHSAYNEPTSWIGTSVKQGVTALHGRFPLFAGLSISDFKGNMNDLRAGIKYALDNGAAGVSLFIEITDDILSVLKEFK